MDALTDQLTALRRVRYMQVHHEEIEKRSRASTYPQDSDAGTDKSHLENYTNTEKQNTLIRFLQLLEELPSQKSMGDLDYTLPTYIKE
ncbi:hypothetical protein AnigIFM63604_006500 [Aspergillus niger]|uniref:Uncharacterized protein n=1 Tax=Aspergillus niger TaxID=5061 RepID=A0A9W6EB38_ASPNG|nr:hypothetical protein AnigIFM63604_006500 [Aspergillus niger]